MNLDVLYRVPRDLIWKYAKQFAPPHSIDIIIYKPCLDTYTTKKTFWNSLTRLKENGVFCIECDAENVSNIIRLVNDSGYEHKVSYFIAENRIAIYVFAYDEMTYEPSILNSYRITRWEEEVPIIITNVVGSRSIVMLLGDVIMPFAPAIKRTNKYVIVAGDDDIYAEIVKNEGIREMRIV